MRSDSLNRWVTLGANLGVLLGLFLLVVELGQNRDMMRAQTRNELSMGIVDLLMAEAENPQLASVNYRGNTGQELTSEERYQYERRTRAMFRYWENVHYQYRQGLYDEAEFSAQRTAWRRFQV